MVFFAAICLTAYSFNMGLCMKWCFCVLDYWCYFLVDIMFVIILCCWLIRLLLICFEYLLDYCDVWVIILLFPFGFLMLCCLYSEFGFGFNDEQFVWVVLCLFWLFQLVVLWLFICSLFCLFVYECFWCLMLCFD